jgi:ABC-type Fe3+-hydroxamate transport system substrate-binding protein
MPQFTDQLHRTIRLSAPPRKIVSLVPSQTELLADLGLEAEVAGITKFCVRPESWFRTKKRVGGTKNLDLDLIAAIEPELVIAGKEENIREQVAALQTRYPVWTSDVKNLDDACQMIVGVGAMTARETAAAALAGDIRERFSRLIRPSRRLKAAYLIWKDPFMAAGGDCFIHDMMERCGWLNIFAARPRYPVTSIEAIREAGCELLLLSSEPFPFGRSHVQELSRALPATRVLAVDGQFFSWYGSRMLQAPEYFRQLGSMALP